VTAEGRTGDERTGAYDAIVVGAGHNGLVCAAYLAKGGLRTLVLERRDRVGGTVETSELAPGVRAPRVAHTVGRLRPQVVRDLGLAQHGLELVQPDVRVFAPQPDGRGITLWSDVGRTSAELRSWSAADAEAYPAFDRRIRALGRFLGQLATVTPPDLRDPSLADAVAGLRLGLGFKGLGRREGQELLRVLPMAVADFVAESFETEALRAVLAARGIAHTHMGPWSAGTSQVLLADAAGNDGGAAAQTVFARGGPGALADALASAAGASGAEIRTGVEVAAVTIRDGRASGVALASGDEITSRVVASGLDPKRTLLGLLDPVALGPSLGWRTSNLRMSGTVAKVNLALSALPRFTAASGDDGERRLRGRILVGATGIDDLERAFDAAKYGRVSDPPWLEVTIPSLVDPSLVETGGHVMSVVAQYVPYHRRDGSWEDARARDRLGKSVVTVLESVAPGIGKLVTAREVLTPLDLEQEYGLTEGHPLHGDPGLDQFFAWRPLLGHARYRMPVEGLYLCGSGAHPGGGVTGGPGANAAREILADLRR
jgi:phytoene dehydrogenase-like protein